MRACSTVTRKSGGQVENHIGEKVYSTETGMEIEVKELGPLSDKKLTTEPRPMPYHSARAAGRKMPR